MIRLFGKRTKVAAATRETAHRVGVSPAGAPVGFRLLDKQLFDGNAGKMLREAGLDPDSMGNIVGSSTAVSEVIADDFATLQQGVAAANRVQPHALAPCHLLAPSLWDGHLCNFLVKQLDLWPYRPWNTILLPVTDAGAKAFGLPLVPVETISNAGAEAANYLAEVHMIFEGANDPAAATADYILGCVRENYACLFPADSERFTPRVKRARGNVRALAIICSGLPVETIIKSHKTFLSTPATQLIA
jgi:hypothetical protein